MKFDHVFPQPSPDFYYDADLRKPLGMFFPHIKLGGMFMEFGVFRGRSISWIARKVPNEVVYGFDSFEGLPEQWADTPRGAFRLPSPPTNLPDNVKLVKGLFQNTLPPFLKMHPSRVSFVHIDCDLYSSTKFVLDTLRFRLHNAVVVFDEINGLPACEEHEGRAFREFLRETGYSYKLIGHHHQHGAGYQFIAPPFIAYHA
jgi:hypothetical protein